MANKIGLFALKPAPASEAALAAALRCRTELSAQRYGDWTAYIVQGGDYGSAPDFCQAASAATGGVGLSIFVFEGSWEFQLFQAGRHIAGLDAYDRPTPVLLGDLAQAAALLSVTPELLKSYCVSPWAGLSGAQLKGDGLRASLEERHAAHRAAPGDEFAPWDEWGFCDFIAKLGFGYPDPAKWTALTLQPPAGGGAAIRSGPRLGEADLVHRATAPGDPGGAAGAPTSAKPWWRFW